MGPKTTWKSEKTNVREQFIPNCIKLNSNILRIYPGTMHHQNYYETILELYEAILELYEAILELYETILELYETILEVYEAILELCL